MAGSGQRMDKEKSGGMRIDDHKFFAGGVDKETIMPRGVHFKGESDADGDGSLMNYEDTSEKIKATQNASVSKAKAHAQKPLHRN